MANESIGESTLPVSVDVGVRPGAHVWSVELVFPIEETLRFVVAPSRRLTIGRDTGADVVVASHQASRRHAELALIGDELILQDLQSLNGTFVNGRSIDRKLLRNGDVIRVGDRIGVVARQRADADSPLVTRIADGLWAGAELRAAVAAAQRVAKTDLPVLIQGATGTGKERVARAIHEWSGRSGAFVAINCAAIPEHLAEAELFGYKKGAFTGAEKPSLGHLRAAHHGTLLLDEVSDLPLVLQAKLLRVVEQQEVQPLGDQRPTPINVRIVAAAQRPLIEQVMEGRFRADLHARFNGVTVSLPPLSERKAEIPSLLVRLLMNRLGSTPPLLDALLVERLVCYPWPGNVRELDLLARRLLGLHGHEPHLRVEHLAGSELADASIEPSPELAPPPEPEQAPGLSRDERDVRALLSGLRENQGNLSQAAAGARVSRQRAYRLLQDESSIDLKALRKGTLA